MTKEEVEASSGDTGWGVADWKITLEVDAGGGLKRESSQSENTK